MSYAVQPPLAAAPPPAAAPRRPTSVALASVLLIVMAVAGLAYAVATLATAPGTVDRFRSAAGAGDDVDGYVTVVWMGAALAAVLAVLLFALYVVLALGLRRGSNGFRIATLVVCALGLLAGCASATTVGIQRSGDSVPGSLGAALTDAYPASWIPLNIGLAIAQIAGYVLVGALLLAAPREFFGRPSKPAPPDPFAVNSQLPPAGYAQPGYYGPPQPVYGAPYPSAPMAPSPAYPAPAPAHPEEPSPWAPPRPVAPAAPSPAAPSPASAPTVGQNMPAVGQSPESAPPVQEAMQPPAAWKPVPAQEAEPQAVTEDGVVSASLVDQPGPAEPGAHRTSAGRHPDGSPERDTDEGFSARPSS
ncbi:hypothetical protein COUCH_00335 [Couchioplanes caeruleus]|uniref:hypothetical protein n=1 Tax=Couchioplanes caeruleus TaxID=56438 RepID=UPI0020C05918|nr:hypothetical protein [Couchioplanes caeruleus]UQU64854.1 hypothetical protein COUCH_00335 [Couchioplanes caeruleus]